MKFLLNSAATCSNRIGCIKDIERLPSVVLETPMLLFYTKGGSVPHLTHEVLQMVTKDPQPILVPASTVAHCQEAVAAYRKGIADFVGLKEHLTFCTLHDPLAPTPQGFNDKDTISMWPRYGRRQLDPDKYMDMMEAFQPDMYHVLCDGDTNRKSSKKRVQKSIDRSFKMLQQCLLRHQDSEVLKKRAVLGAVEGGYSVAAREESAQQVGSSSVLGFVIDGFHNNGPDVEHLTFADVRPVLEETLRHLPKEKLRVIHGCWNPEALLSMVQLGIDVFDSSYACMVTDRGGALVFHNQINPLDVPRVSNGEKSGDGDLPEPLKKKKRTDESKGTSIANRINESDTEGPSAKTTDDTKTLSSTQDRRFEISLAEEKYAEDFSPISELCSCLTCQKHTRAYIHHLLQTNELLGPVLLTIHNLHHYVEFFRNIRAAVKSNSLENLKHSVTQEWFHCKS